MILQSLLTEEFEEFAGSMRMVFGFCMDAFKTQFTIFGYTFSFFELAVAFMCIGLVFLIVRRVADL